ncbi:MAG: hypothetical protein R3B13_38990 [Polyangiaceae bacterium]
MGPAIDLGDGAVLVQVVVHGVRVGDEVARVAGEQIVDGVAVVMLLNSNNTWRSGATSAEVTVATLLLGLHEDAGGAQIVAQARPGASRRRVVAPASAGRASRKSSNAPVETVALVDALQSIERLVVLPAPHDRIGKHPRAGETARDRKCGSRSNEDGRRFVVLGSVLQHELV